MPNLFCEKRTFLTPWYSHVRVQRIWCEKRRIGKLGMFCFLETPVFRFALLPYYRQVLKVVFFLNPSFLIMPLFSITRKSREKSKYLKKEKKLKIKIIHITFKEFSLKQIKQLFGRRESDFKPPYYKRLKQLLLLSFFLSKQKPWRKDHFI